MSHTVGVPPVPSPRTTKALFSVPVSGVHSFTETNMFASTGGSALHPALYSSKDDVSNVSCSSEGSIAVLGPAVGGVTGSSTSVASYTGGTDRPSKDRAAMLRVIHSGTAVHPATRVATHIAVRKAKKVSYQ